MRFDAFGRLLEVVRRDDAWIVFELGNEGKKRLARDVVIPPAIAVGEVATYLSDLLHEEARPTAPEVRLLD